MPETILVTGGAGFIGSHLVKELVKSGFSVRLLDNLSNGSLENIREVLGSIEFIKGDIRDKNVVEGALKGVDAVVHLAALIDVAESVEKPELYLEVNVNGTFNVARASRKVSALIFASTCAVYGEPVKIPIGEDHPLSPKSPYAATKIAGEAFVQAYGNLYGYRPVILRLFNVYGPRQSKAYAGVITEFVKRATLGEPPIIFGDGEQTRDFVHVKDVAKAIIKALDSDNASGIYNVGSGVAITINDLAHLVLKLAGKENVEPIHEPPRQGDIKHSQANINRAKMELGYNPSVSLEEGIREILNLGKK